MIKNDALEEFLFLFSQSENIPFNNFEDALVDDFNELDVPFLKYKSIVGWFNYLKTEIQENLLSLNEDDKLLYLDFLYNKLEYETIKFDNENLIELLIYYKVDTEILDFNENKRLEELLNRSFKSTSGHENLIKLRDLHREYYKYLLNIERDKVLNLINDFMANAKSNNDFTEKLKWIGKPSQLGFIIGSLAEFGYIEAPKHKSGDINYNQFAKLVKKTFQLDTTEGTLSKYLNLESEKGQEIERKFKEKKFNIPHIKEIS